MKESIVMFGVLLVLVGLFIISVYPYLLFFGICVALIGFVTALLGLYIPSKQDEIAEAFWELRQEIPICPKCEKEILEGNYLFCPFCGTSLERKSED